MSYVYGKLNQRKKEVEEIYCKKQACNIQKCIANYRHVPNVDPIVKCEKFIQEYEKCAKKSREIIDDSSDDSSDNKL